MYFKMAQMSKLAKYNTNKLQVDLKDVKQMTELNDTNTKGGPNERHSLNNTSNV